jgi:hypothetical protein
LTVQGIGGVTVDVDAGTDTLTIGYNGMTFQSITGFDGNPSEELAFRTDSTRSNKNLSLESAQLSYSERRISNNGWMDIGNAFDATTGWIMPYDGTVVRCTGQSSDPSATWDFDLYVDGVNTGSLITLSGSGNQIDTNTAADVNFSSGQKLRIRTNRVSGGGTGGDTAVTLWVKWRT